MWIDNISRYMYDICMINDKEEYWSEITDDECLYWYCRNIQDRPELYNKLTDNKYIYYYCKYIKNRPELANKITEKRYVYKYNSYVETDTFISEQDLTTKPIFSIILIEKE